MAVESRLQLQPYDTTVRYYVDGTNGLDGALGTSWATAWKTLAFAQSRIEQILATNPGNLRLDLYVRGAFANEDLILSGALAGSTTVNVIHHVDDWTEVSTGTVNTVAATSLGHGMRELTFNAPWVPAAADEGRLLVFTEGTNRIVYQVLRVSGATVTISTTTVPAWLVGGGTVAVSVREPSVSGIANMRYGYQRAQHWDTAYSWPANVVLGIACERFSAVATNGLRACVFATGTLPIRFGQCYECRTEVASDNFYVLRTRAAEYGLLGTNVAGETCRVGSKTTTTGANGIVRFEGSEYCMAVGRFASTLGVMMGSYSSYHSYCSSNGIDATSGLAVVSNSILSGQAVSNHASAVAMEKTSWLSIPAAGLPNGLVTCRKGGWVQLASTVDGTNTGTGATLYGCKVEKGGKLQMDSCPTALTGDDGDWYIEDGEAEFSGALTIAARKGDGPDIYAGPNAKVHFGGNITKSATNPSGGGTANAVIRARRGAKITQAVGSSFTLPAGSGNNTTDYGANGAIDIETCCDVALGLLAGGNAVATNTAVRVKKASRLAHAGAAPTWGAAALDLGGNAADEMPAAVTSDMAAGVPEDCWVLPGAA